MHLLCVTLAAVMFHVSFCEAHPKLEKLRRGSSGLVPFPRVGRGSAQSWKVQPSEYAIYDAEEPLKRQLYAFPRVGRGGGGGGAWSPLQLAQLEALLLLGAGGGGGGGGGGGEGGARHNKRNVDSSGNMWFGPRLGRAAKRELPDYEEESIPKQSLPEQGYPEHAEAGSDTRERRQTN